MTKGLRDEGTVVMKGLGESLDLRCFVLFLLAQGFLFLSLDAQRFFVLFLLAQKMNQKRAPETITSAMPYARYACLIGATGMAEVRAVSGLPPRVPGVALVTL